MSWKDLFLIKNKRNKTEQFDAPQSFSFYNFVNEGSAMNLSAFFSATNLISNSIAILPIKLKKTKEGEKNNVEEHKILDLFDNPNNTLTKFNLIKKVIEDVILYGNGYIYIVRDDKTGEPIKLRYLKPSSVVVMYNQLNDEVFYNINLGKETKKIYPIDLIHCVLHTFDGVNGVSITSFANRCIKLANSMEESAQNFFSNGGDLGGWVKVSSNVTTKQIENIQQSLNKQTSTGKKIMILPNNMDYNKLSMNNNDAQLLGSREFSVDELARWFNCPSQLLKGENITDIEAVMNQFYFTCLLPYVNMLEEQLKKLLMPKDLRQNITLYIETNEVLRVSKIQQQQYYCGLLQNGVLSVNEVRESLGLNKIKGADDLFVAFTDINQNKINKEKEEGEKDENN